MFKGLLHAAHLAMMIGQKILEIHNSGVSKEIGDKIHGIMSEVHDVIDKHHKEQALERILDKEDAE